MKTIKIILFYILSFTWGVIMTLFGCFCTLGLLITGHKPKRFYLNIYFEVGENWGGFEAGCFFICCKNPGKHLKQHESGHGIQNIILGPLMPFIVCIPSATRYWLREFKTLRSKTLYSLILCTIFWIISAACIILGILFDLLFLLIIGACIAAYFIIIFIWLITIEIPKYENGAYVDYDDFLVEASASKIGAKLYK